ncbi:hypothetical protein A3K34_04345 [candidate division WWE3 bacterium RIFOXYC1_FULL_40_10]|uniref:Uncharacterized protein n=1 Tax=candidate division WWE3 bacterium RIFOXYA2_FULL_46_9 TaxID=1802636 RepID=A0A1F4W0Y7_UNCKA|nr:MAG: hypothetical protein A3K58_04345 [candidate division WWE3 bacterium RIFOXYB1_FULL_40_22]OGC62072.1 MAG: hypothetical protein A3K37_04345 [candidate division WWE3 bacterium RIFOXYA1_FULL_40_11]OGC63087.1 MAG: hypothetical protein A2264_00090 [candidate division WWE3 bacterium RIFOXYA2_FULL_46_9]OGC64983.1 MAG: hypothetical protein A2326_03020 [candidate division WWE3 bacterium RIFOXYB2_FULL_41_6]OGC66455.1 MAG: hypothetical protein A3K34_04345 [candidate division WWE3 bacterium RIFOXYC1_
MDQNLPINPDISNPVLPLGHRVIQPAKVEAAGYMPVSVESVSSISAEQNSEAQRTPEAFTLPNQALAPSVDQPAPIPPQQTQQQPAVSNVVNTTDQVLPEHKLITSDTLTTLADQEEQEFIDKVEEAHGVGSHN